MSTELPPLSPKLDAAIGDRLTKSELAVLRMWGFDCLREGRNAALLDVERLVESFVTTGDAKWLQQSILIELRTKVKEQSRG